jgi:hypothetical protein
LKINNPCRCFSLINYHALILDKSLEKEWLNASFSKGSINEIINTGVTTKEFEAYTISENVTNNRIESNTRDILKPYYYPELNTLFLIDFKDYSSYFSAHQVH